MCVECLEDGDAGERGEEGRAGGPATPVSYQTAGRPASSRAGPASRRALHLQISLIGRWSKWYS